MGFFVLPGFDYNRKPCGSGLAHESGGSGNLAVSDALPSRASSLPHEICGVAGLLCTTKNPVGVSLLTKAAGQANYLCQTHCIREQARSHMRFFVWPGFEYTRKPSGTELAHKGGGSGNLAVSDTLPSRAGSLPHRICGVVGHLSTPANPVGVGLLTKAVGHANFLCLTHCIREQARSHMGFFVLPGFEYTRKPCGSGLAHESGGSGKLSVSDTLPSRASSLPHELALEAKADCGFGHFHRQRWPGAA